MVLIESLSKDHIIHADRFFYKSKLYRIFVGKWSLFDWNSYEKSYRFCTKKLKPDKIWTGKNEIKEMLPKYE